MVAPKKKNLGGVEGMHKQTPRIIIRMLITPTNLTGMKHRQVFISFVI